MMSGIESFLAADAARLFAIDEAALLPAARAVIDADPMRYRVANAPERDAIMGDVVRALVRRKFEPVGAHRKQVWERGWGENLEMFVQNGYNFDALRPHYMHADRPFRLHGDYVFSDTPDVEFRLSRVIRAQLFGTYFRSVSAVYEFGAGTGANLVELNRLFPDKTLVGLDWTEASTNIIAQLHRKLSPRITGRPFDFFAPDRTLQLLSPCGVLTCGALEQTGDQFEPFLEYLLTQRPQIVVHLEPILEYYEEGRFFDVLAAEYHRQRGYLSGFVPRLRALAMAGAIRILMERRTGFGSLYDEGYSVVVWEPAAAS